VTAILATLAFVSIGLMLWQFWLGMRYPLKRSAPPSPNAPAVTILKPLKGLDSHTEQCLRSWLTLKYGGPIQLLFGVADEIDPVCELVRRLIHEYPERNAELVLCPKRLGANAKVSTLIQLARQARHDVLVISDADVWVPEDVMCGIAAAMPDEATGLVSCFYAEATPANNWMRLEAVAVNADFWTQVLQAQSLGKMHFALGAVMAMRGAALAKIGGFESLADYLADDYQLGHKIAATGASVGICPMVVECRSDPMTARQVWSHQLRWARTIRVCQPVQYFFSILGNATLWTFLLTLAGPSFGTYTAASYRPTSGSHVLVSITGAGILMLSVFVLRILSALLLQKRLTRRTDHFPWWFLPPLKDFFATVVWAAAFLGNTVTWRGQRYRVNKGGKLTEL
jgi:ceramide glucosyltransferase